MRGSRRTTFGEPRNNTKRLKVDLATAETTMNHLQSGMERIYNGYALEEEKAAWLLKWEQ